MEKETDIDKENKEAEEEQQKSEDMISKANAAAARLEEANKKTAELVSKQERINVERTLGGQTTAGNQEKTEEQKEVDGAKELLKGTGYEGVLDEK